MTTETTQRGAIEAALDRTIKFIGPWKEKLDRVDLVNYFRLISKVNTGFTLPVFESQAELEEIVFLKNLFALWIIVVDDELDRGKGRVGLDSSTLVLMRHGLEFGNLPVVDEPFAATVLKALLKSLEDRPGRSMFFDAFCFDVRDMIHGFEYSSLLRPHASLGLSSVKEYVKYSSMTVGIKQFLDMDAIFFRQLISAKEYRLIRDAYDCIAHAIRYANDAAGLKRDLEDEAALDVIQLMAIEGEKLSAGWRLEGQVDYQALHGELLPFVLSPFVRHTYGLARQSLDEAKILLSQVTSLETSGIWNTADSLVKNFAHIEPSFR